MPPLARRRIALAVALLLILGLGSGCGVVARGLDAGAREVWRSQLLRQGRHGPLTDTEKKWARIAWKYFERNYNPGTGLVNSVDGNTSAGMGHVADTLAALVAARELELIDTCDFDARLSALLQFLNRMGLFYGRLPNLRYGARTGQMFNYGGSPESIGWSATDLGRLLVWLHILKTRYPEYAEYVDGAVLRWNFCDLIDDCGTLYGGAKNEGGKDFRTFQEGRLGLEEYAARGFHLWGFNTDLASRLEPFETALIYNIPIPHDARNRQRGGAIAPVLSQAYLMSGLEFNWDRPSDDYPGLDSVHTDGDEADLADRIYRVQAKRYREDHIFTARTDHRLPDDPYYVYGTVFAEGFAWNVLTPGGQYRPDQAVVATKAAFGMWALWDTRYTDELMKIVSCLYDPERGWYEGRRERTGGYVKICTLPTNAAVLEALLYKVQGKLFPGNSRPGLFQSEEADPFRGGNRCLPSQRDPCYLYADDPA
jgi:hypothetical protein